MTDKEAIRKLRVALLLATVNLEGALDTYRGMKWERTSTHLERRINQLETTLEETLPNAIT